jgi:DNA-binding CsgD family transcriptional regulator
LKPPQIGTARTTLNFHGREEEFLRWACTELTYKEIADRMCLSPRTIDGYRESLFEKLELKSRVGLVLFAIRNGVVQLA